MAENADTVADYQSEEDVNLDGNNGGHNMPSPKRQRVQEPDDYVEEDGSDRELQQELDLQLELDQGVVRESSSESGAEDHEGSGDVSDQEGQEGQGDFDDDDALDEDEAADVQLQQDIETALSSLSHAQLDTLFFAAVTRFRDDVLFGQEEARNSLLMSACVQHPEFMEEVDRLRSTSARVEGQGTATSPLQLLSDGDNNSDNGEGVNECDTADNAGGEDDEEDEDEGEGEDEDENAAED
eukprot:g1961.t1